MKLVLMTDITEIIANNCIGYEIQLERLTNRGILSSCETMSGGITVPRNTPKKLPRKIIN